MRLGAILSKADQASEQAVAQYGVHLGTAFQLVDDVLDYSGDAQEIGKNLGDDLAEGKPTLPLIYAMQHGSPAQAELVRTAIEQGDLALFDQVLQVCNRPARWNTHASRPSVRLMPHAQTLAVLRIRRTKKH